MDSESSEFRAIEKRPEVLASWLKTENLERFLQQRHLEEGSQERLYWHYGYMTALKDILRLLMGNDFLPNRKSCNGDSSNSTPMA